MRIGGETQLHYTLAKSMTALMQMRPLILTDTQLVEFLEYVKRHLAHVPSCLGRSKRRDRPRYHRHRL